jgi:hypothetical protein
MLILAGTMYLMVTLVAQPITEKMSINTMIGNNFNIPRIDISLHKNYTKSSKSIHSSSELCNTDLSRGVADWTWFRQESFPNCVGYVQAPSSSPTACGNTLYSTRDYS